MIRSHAIKIYVPSKCSCMTDIPLLARNQVLEDVARLMSEWFGGCTGQDGWGWYKDPQGKVVREPVHILESAVGEEQFVKYRERAARLAVAVAERLSQWCVTYVEDGKTDFLEPRVYRADQLPHAGVCKGKVVPHILASDLTGDVHWIPRKSWREMEKLTAIQNAVRSFSSLDDARELFCRVLNYDFQRGELPCAHWPTTSRSLLHSEPAMVAAHAAFKIVYLRLSTADLRRSSERQVFNRLLHDDPTFRGAFVVSNVDQKDWEIVLPWSDTKKGTGVVLRRLRLGVEAVRTATECLAGVEIAEGEESTLSAEDTHRRWVEVTRSEPVTKQFFSDVANWYFWALRHAKFPANAPKESDGRDHVSIIRLITRLVFCWFLREKGLLPTDLFDQKRLDEMLVGFAPGKASNKQSTYYRAILQNLFFATLSTEMEKRDWAKENKNFMAHSLYRYKECFQKPAEALGVFRNIPFLNGGLFECLDKDFGENAKPRYLRVDGFSRRPDSQPVVPDFLFFGDEQVVDLHKEYGESDPKPVRVRGLIHTLLRYRFTIEESTPVEEEVALDPELAGRIFENLLAAYNPETGVTARKQTGSFYTPREIVNYMVDEALLVLLRTRLSASCPSSEDVEPRLRSLLAYGADENRFTPAETDVLISAIDALKALDPAVGSGAFPMGILHKLVFILSKLDPRNEQWRERQKARLRALTSDAENSIDDVVVRDRVVRDLEDQIASVDQAFERNAFDYGRKLYLIENCLYGVDIQPIAVQIAKMRFFISLIVDQRIDEALPNRGVLPLPNLETKLVAANSLIGIDRPEQMVLRSPEVIALEAELRRVRDRHFLARTPSAKAKCRDDDSTLRAVIAEQLKSDGWKPGVAIKLSQWDPYNQNTTSDFFDAEWMFGVTDGFTLTIGNPPYVRADEPSQWNRRQRKAIIDGGQYETLWEKWDLFVPFVEKAYKLLSPAGVSTLIVSDAFCHSKYAEKPQKWLLTNARVMRLDFCSDIKIFDAGVHNLIYLIQKETDAKNRPLRRLHRGQFGSVTELPTDEQACLTHRAFFPGEPDRCEYDSKTVTLEEICYVSVGMVVNAHERLAPGAFTMDDLVQDTRDERHPKRFAEGKHLDKWLPRSHKWLEWGTKRAPALFRRQTFPEIYDSSEKILVQRSPGPDPKCCYDERKLHFTESTVAFIPWRLLAGVRNNSLKKAARYSNEEFRADLPKREELEKTSKRFAVKFLLAVMNSSVAREFLRANRRSNIHLYPDDWKKLPIPDAAGEGQALLVALVDRILAARRQNNSADVSQLEHGIDERVRELYGLTRQEATVDDLAAVARPLQGRKHRKTSPGKART